MANLSAFSSNITSSDTETIKSRKAIAKKNIKETFETHLKGKKSNIITFLTGSHMSKNAKLYYELGLINSDGSPTAELIQEIPDFQGAPGGEDTLPTGQNGSEKPKKTIKVVRRSTDKPNTAIPLFEKRFRVLAILGLALSLAGTNCDTLVEKILKKADIILINRAK